MLLSFFPFLFSVLIQILTVKKPKVCTNGSSSFSRKTLLLECQKDLVSSTTFNFVTLWYHTTSPCHTFVLLMHTLVAVVASVAGTCTCLSWPIKGDWESRRGGSGRYCMRKWVSFLGIKACKQYHHCVQRLLIKCTEYVCGKTRIQWKKLFNFD